jgi:RNA polymerase primary sigma factor
VQEATLGRAVTTYSWEDYAAVSRPATADDRAYTVANFGNGDAARRDADGLTLFLQRINRFPVLGAAHERELARRVAEGDETARNTLILHNLRLVVYVVKRYRGLGVPFLDLIQEGYLGLNRAVEKFDHTLGYRFSTYATLWIRQSCQRALAEQSAPVSVPTHVRWRQGVLQQERAELERRLGREPTTSELAQAAGMTLSHARNALVAALPPASLDADRDHPSFAMQIADDDAVDPGENVDRARLRAATRDALDTLMPLERSILEMRFGLTDGVERSLEDIGRHLRMSRGRVAMLERQAYGSLSRRLVHAFGQSA